MINPFTQPPVSMETILCIRRETTISLILIFFLFPFISSANTSSFAFNEFEDCMEKGMQALEEGDLSQAMIWVQKAKLEAKSNKNPAWKVRAGKLDKKTKRYYKPYFEKIREAKRFAEGHNYKEATLQLEKAQKSIKGSHIIDLDEARYLDEKLAEDIQQRIATTETLRRKNYQDLILSGQRSIQLNDPTNALLQFEAAQSQMFQNRGEWEKSRIEYHISKAKYKLHMQDGDQLFAKNDFEKAYEAYKMAKEISAESMDVDNRIRKVESELIKKYIREGDQAFAKREYEQSGEAYKKAQSFENSTEAEQRLKRHYTTFLESGDRFLKAEGYSDALTNYQWAQLFMDTPEIKVKINQAKNSIAYTKHFEAGESHVNNEKLSAAKRSFDKAARHAETTEVLEQLNYLRNYKEHIRTGNKLMKKSPEEALGYFKRAQALFDTQEVAKLIAKVDGKSTGSGFTTKNGKFY